VKIDALHLSSPKNVLSKNTYRIYFIKEIVKLTRVSFEKMNKEITHILVKKGFSLERAEKCAHLYAEASLEIRGCAKGL
jgi:hypothetical protein